MLANPEDIALLGQLWLKIVGYPDLIGEWHDIADSTQKEGVRLLQIPDWGGTLPHKTDIDCVFLVV